MQIDEQDEAMAAQPSTSNNDINLVGPDQVYMEEDQVALLEHDETINVVRFKPQSAASAELPIVATAHVVGSVKLHQQTINQDDGQPSF